MNNARYDEAIAKFRDALSISHDAQNRLALGLALLKAERPGEALIYLNEVLRVQPGSGAANLGIAEIYAQEPEQFDNAVLHYHRAIYGSWPEKPDEHRFQTRLELVKMLARHGRNQQAQAELVAAAAAAPNDPALKKELGRMLIDYGLPKNAVDLFRVVGAQGRPDAGAEDGLGDAEFALADYPRALDAYRSALKIDPEDAEAAKRADESERILALDPTMRGLGAAERFARSEKILSGVVTEVMRCAAGTPLPENVQSELKQAQAALAHKKRPPSYTDAAEENVALAEQLWGARGAACAMTDEVLERTMAKLTR